MKSEYKTGGYEGKVLGVAIFASMIFPVLTALLEEDVFFFASLASVTVVLAFFAKDQWLERNNNTEKKAEKGVLRLWGKIKESKKTEVEREAGVVINFIDTYIRDSSERSRFINMITNTIFVILTSSVSFLYKGVNNPETFEFISWMILLFGIPFIALRAGLSIIIDGSARHHLAIKMGIQNAMGEIMIDKRRWR